ncbi:hypothetical protein [Paraburkholderia sp. DHOC27]|uniref:hypothetical protein n=1 Tax=Paraburkholderia sp. DHOC27 TaxID=2303330 RepID=UPI0011C1243A|nr:hypothetical protein [Paraburkholderia sp. DHOC27]
MPKPTWKTRLIVALGFVIMVVLARDKSHLQIATDYRIFTSVKESELIHTSATFVSISPLTGAPPDHEIQTIEFPDGHRASARFVELPTAIPRKQRRVGLGNFQGHSLWRLTDCTRLDFELFKDAPSYYWIYAVSCDGEPVLSYPDTMRYLSKQMDVLGVDRDPYGPITRFFVKFL